MSVKLRVGDIAVFKNGEETMVTGFKLGSYGLNTIKLFFNKEVEGRNCTQDNWNYNVNGTWLGVGNNIAKVIHQ